MVGIGEATALRMEGSCWEVVSETLASFGVCTSFESEVLIPAAVLSTLGALEVVSTLLSSLSLRFLSSRLLDNLGKRLSKRFVREGVILIFSGFIFVRSTLAGLTDRDKSSPAREVTPVTEEGGGREGGCWLEVVVDVALLGEGGT